MYPQNTNKLNRMTGIKLFPTDKFDVRKHVIKSLWVKQGEYQVDEHRIQLCFRGFVKLANVHSSILVFYYVDLIRLKHC